jgi:hypothetical protein
MDRDVVGEMLGDEEELEFARPGRRRMPWFKVEWLNNVVPPWMLVTCRNGVQGHFGSGRSSGLSREEVPATKSRYV